LIHSKTPFSFAMSCWKKGGGHKFCRNQTRVQRMVSEYVQNLGVILMSYKSCITYTSHWFSNTYALSFFIVDHILFIAPTCFGVRRHHLQGALKMVMCWSIKADMSVWICGLRNKRVQ